MNIIHLKTRIDHKAIANAYGYNPIPEGYKAIPPVDISIDWQAGAKQRQELLRAAMTCNPRYQVTNGWLTPDVPIATDERDLQLQIYRSNNFPNGGIDLRLALKDRNIDVANYLVSLYRGAWNINHRITDEAYRGKGIASHMIAEIENCIQIYADTKGETQEIILETSQLSVLNLFLKNGYEIADEDKQRFADVIEKLENGDPQYLLTSCLANFRSRRRDRKTWYIFERETYERLGENIWDDAAKLVRNSVRFKLRKKIVAQSNEVSNRTEEVRERVQAAE